MPLFAPFGFSHSDSLVQISLMTKHPLKSKKPSCDKTITKECQNRPFYCIAVNKSHHVRCTLLFPPHLHLPAAQPFFSLSPADVIWIPGLESHPGNRPPPQPPSLALHTQRRQVMSYFSHLQASFLSLYVKRTNSNSFCLCAPLWGSRSFCRLARLQGRKVRGNGLFVKSFNKEVKSWFSSVCAGINI